MGVISATNLTAGLCFGPIPTSLMIADPAYLVGNMTTDVFPEIPKTEVNLLASRELHRLIEWVPFLRSARCPAEQGLELLRKPNGDIVYRTCRTVRRGEELLIWFSAEYRQQIGMTSHLPIPNKADVASSKKEKIEKYQCQNCLAEFRYPFPYLSHVTFKCNALKSNNSTSSSLQQKQASRNLKRISSDYSEDDLIDVEAFQELSSLSRGLKRSASQSPPFFLPHKDSHVQEEEQDDFSVSSAFQKVHKKEEGMPTGYVYNPASQIRLSSNMLINHNLVNNNNLASINNNDLFLSMLSPAMMAAAAYGFTASSPQRSISMELAPHSQHHAQHHIIPFINAPSLPFSPLPPLPLSVLAPQLSPRSTPHSPVQCVTQSSSPIKSSNPMVEKLLNHAVTGETVLPNPLSSLNLLQNWCAKCNATFRMTSDLVYHMRTHHKRDEIANETGAQAIVRRRVQKLRCHICGESFKERHHLTRHMTSHD